MLKLIVYVLFLKKIKGLGGFGVPQELSDLPQKFKSGTKSGGNRSMYIFEAIANTLGMVKLF